MFYIISKKRNTIHSEPSRRSWQSNMYKSAAAAKAGITRTMKYYQAAIDEVAEVVAEGKPEYHARRYNAFRDATDTALGRTHLFDINNYEVVAVECGNEPRNTWNVLREIDVVLCSNLETIIFQVYLRFCYSVIECRGRIGILLNRLSLCPIDMLCFAGYNISRIHKSIVPNL